MSGYSVHSFGCRASAADGDAIALELEQRAGLTAGSPDAAQYVVVNTCSVTAQAERTARAMIRRLARVNPAARIVVTGCYAQRAPAELASLPGVSAVVGNSHKASVARIALGLHSPGFVPVANVAPAVVHSPFRRSWIAGEHQDAGEDTLALPLLGAAGRTRPILRVQDGCGNRCSFCVIPETRGPSRSVPLAQALAAAQSFAAAGGQELVLSGINLGRWGADLAPGTRLATLVRALLEETTLPRLRLSSIEPMDWNHELLALLADHARGAHPRLAPHAHLPLQSGADSILRRMHRRYRPWHYAERVTAIRQLLPDSAIGADVMVGFPGETDALFQETYDLIEALPLTYLHLFPFSARPATVAEPMHRQQPVPGAAVRERMAAFTVLDQRKRAAFEGSFAGRTLSAVTLADGSALTGNFLRVRLRGPVQANRMVHVRLASHSPEQSHLQAEVV